MLNNAVGIHRNTNTIEHTMKSKSRSIYIDIYVKNEIRANAHVLG